MTKDQIMLQLEEECRLSKNEFVACIEECRGYKERIRQLYSNGQLYYGDDKVFQFILEVSRSAEKLNTSMVTFLVCKRRLDIFNRLDGDVSKGSEYSSVENSEEYMKNLFLLLADIDKVKTPIVAFKYTSAISFDLDASMNTNPNAVGISDFVENFNKRYKNIFSEIMTYGFNSK